ncbi:hypothetical protein FD755_022735 [Muntiacus reevesi]|uniref:Uncharacterized protein n=2 Tax=Muntiacus TaxID=9885 RepID=A0A5N3VXV7_MUNRE|nr:hypothetical protein FD754_021353 [Muntiacus muntjak]KAB0354197.1 hypothetical protein FD755_022735 [Muntiacus reevesi]
MSLHLLYYCSEPTLDVKIAFCQVLYSLVFPFCHSILHVSH